MPEIQNPKRGYDLEERTFSRRVGTKTVRLFVKTLPKTIVNGANELEKVFSSILEKSK